MPSESVVSFQEVKPQVDTTSSSGSTITSSAGIQIHSFSGFWTAPRVFSQENTWKLPKKKSTISRIEEDLTWFAVEGIKSKLSNKRKNLWSIVKVLNSMDLLLSEETTQILMQPFWLSSF